VCSGIFFAPRQVQGKQKIVFTNIGLIFYLAGVLLDNKIKIIKICQEEA